MIRAIIFDLDGVLVQTEKIKALSYGIAAQRLLDLPQPDKRAIEAYREIVGAARKIATSHVMEKVGLEAKLRPLMAKYGVSEPWQVLSTIRVSIYNEMVADPQFVRDNKWPHSVQLLRFAKEASCQTALVTMSPHDEVIHIVHSLGLERELDLMLTGEDVSRSKPDPEIYLLAAKRLGLPPGECLVLEDSVNGVKAALAAGMNVISMATPFTSARLHSEKLLAEEWTVHNPARLAEIVRRRIAEHNRNDS
ncbi:MAG: HAD family phosphatase [Dehalococcoidales bacterium]